MESGVASLGDGEVEAVLINNGQAVEKGDVLLTFKPATVPYELM